MDEEQLQAMIKNLLRKGDKDMGEGDYQDMLANYMHAMNHGGSQDDLAYLVEAMGGKRREAMMQATPKAGGQYGGNPQIAEGRSGLAQLLRSVK